MRLTLNPFAKSAKKKKTRRARKSQLRRRSIVLGIAATVLFGFVAGIWHLSAIGWPGRAWTEAGERFHTGSAAAGLAVSEVVVEGRKHAARDDLLKALNVSRGMPILAFDPSAARAEIERLGWVKHATVTRRLPDVVYVRIEERVPLALWQRKGKLRLIDREGTVILDRNVAAFADLPLIVGDDAPKQAAALLDLLKAFPEIDELADAAIRVSGRRWNLRLATGIDVRLPETGIAEALGRLADLHHRKNILDRDVIAIDLRKPDRLIVRVNPGARERIGLDGKNT